MIARDYQVTAFDQILAAWDAGHKRVMLQLPTGGGKTQVIAMLKRYFLELNKRTMFVAHREELITQAWATLHKHKIMSGVIKSGVAPAPQLPSQVGSIQTMVRRKRLPPSHVIFIDEAHHALDDNSYGQVIKEHYPDALVLGVTATPYRLNGRGFTKLFDHLVVTIQIGELINRGFLVPFRYFISSSPDMSHVQIKKGDYDIEETAEVMMLAPLVEAYETHAKGLSGMVFAVNVVHSKIIVANYVAAGYTAAHIDANTPIEERRAIIQNFRDKKILILSNVGIATEGFDVPNMDFVQLARPTKSLSLFLQMVGRASRVDNDVIKDAISDEQRKFNISCSSKPCAIILDNAGLWLDHGLPDEPKDWHRYFVGVNKKDKNPFDEFIEIVQFVAEDKTGRRVETDIPSEVEGMKLVEVKKILHERTENILSLRELDKLIAMGYNLRQVNKVGYFAFKGFKAHCKKNRILISDPIWDEIHRRLVSDPSDGITKEGKNYDRLKDILKATHGHAPDVMTSLTSEAHRIYNRRVAPLEALRVSASFIQKERDEYLTLDKFNLEKSNEGT